MMDRCTTTSNQRALAVALIFVIAWLAACAGANGDPAPAAVDAGAAPAGGGCADAGAAG